MKDEPPREVPAVDRSLFHVVTHDAAAPSRSEPAPPTASLPEPADRITPLRQPAADRIASLHEPAPPKPTARASVKGSPSADTEPRIGASVLSYCFGVVTLQ